MRKFLPLLLSALGIILHSTAAAAIPKEFSIDPDHSQVSFSIRHLGISNVTGGFQKFSGTILYDAENLAASKTETTIEVASINTQVAKRDNHLKSADFFQADKFPKMTFVSKSVQPVGADKFKLLGELTIKSITLPVTLDVEVTGSTKDQWGNDRVAFSATGVINRKDFGLTWSKLLETGALVVGDEVKVHLDIQGIRKGA